MEKLNTVSRPIYWQIKLYYYFSFQLEQMLDLLFIEGSLPTRLAWRWDDFETIYWTGIHICIPSYHTQQEFCSPRYLVNILEMSFISGFFVRFLSWPILPVGLQAWPLVMCFSPTTIRSSWRTHASGYALWDTSPSYFLLSFSTSSCPQHLHEADVCVEVMHQFTTDNHSFLIGAGLRPRKSCWFLLIHYIHI